MSTTVTIRRLAVHADVFTSTYITSDGHNSGRQRRRFLRAVCRDTLSSSPPPCHLRHLILRCRHQQWFITPQPGLHLPSSASCYVKLRIGSIQAAVSVGHCAGLALNFNSKNLFNSNRLCGKFVPCSYSKDRH